METTGPPACWTIEGSAPGPHLLITAGVHGDEPEPIAAAARLIAAWPADGMRGRLTIVPLVNEPAFRRAARTADDGLDLARTCPGDPQGSITQRLAAAVSRLIRDCDHYIDLHTGGRLLEIMPLAGYMLHPDPAILARQRLMARAFNLPIIWGTSPNLEGRTLSVARDAGVPAIYAEYGGGTESLIAAPDPAIVEAYTAGCLNVAAALGMIDRPSPQSAVRHAIEDPRDQSGHLQIQHPAPISGRFQARVRLGQHVVEGQRLGTIVDASGHTLVTIRAHETGLVLMLRMVAEVAEGDALAAVLALS